MKSPRLKAPASVAPGPRSLLAAACLSLFPLASFAQSSVTLYGVISVGIGYTSNQGGKSLVSLVNGPTYPARFGFKGREDLGGGYAAIFTLENGFSIGNGALAQGGKLFGRQSWVGLTNDKYGTLTAGRQYDEMAQQLVWSEAAARFTSFYAAHVGDSDNIFDTIRQNNTLRYASPSIAGFSFAGQYSFSNSTNFADNRAYSIGASYLRGPLHLGVAMLQNDNPASTTNTNGAINDSYGFTSPFTRGANNALVAQQRTFAGAAGYDFGFVNLAMNYSNVLFKYQDATGRRVQNIEVIVEKRFRPDILAGIGYTFTVSDLSNGTQGHYNQLNTGVVYSLSKRTDLIGTVSYQRAGGAAKTAQIFTTSASSSKNETAAVAALRVKF
jgi:general bacterial porin, GBP family